MTDEDGATVRVEVMLGERKRLLDAKPATPKDDDHGAQTSAVTITSNLAHHGDDLLDRRRVGWIVHPLVTRAIARRGSRASSPASSGARRSPRQWIRSWDPPPKKTADTPCPTRTDQQQAGYGIGRIASRTNRESC
jgi:hypothetical protein